MKKLAVLLTLFLAAGLWAADFWQSKPFTEWSDKEVTRMVTDSPWAHRMTVSLGLAAPDMAASRNGRDSMPGSASGSMPPFGGAPGATPADAGPGGLPDAARGSRDREDPTLTASGPSVSLVVRWHSALPMKQAITRTKYGSEAGTSPEAKKFLDRVDPDYMISVSGIPKTLVAGDMDRLKKAAKEQTMLTVKGKPPVAPADVEFSPNDPAVDAFFVFPKTAAFTVDDKEIEFTTKIGTMTVRYRFRLKDMVYRGKLEL